MEKLNVLRSLVSQEVMGWELKILPNNDNGFPFYAHFWVKDGEKQGPVNFWNPDFDLKDAYKVLNQFEKYKTEKEGDLHVVRIIIANGDESHEFVAEADTLPKAICLAALAAKGIEVGETYLNEK